MQLELCMDVNGLRLTYGCDPLLNTTTRRKDEARERYMLHASTFF